MSLLRKVTGRTKQAKGASERAQELCEALGVPLLVMFWPDERGIVQDDVRTLREFLKEQTASRPADEVIVLLETHGGEEIPTYLIAQLLHDYANQVEFLVPNEALSGGTMICLAGNRILFGEDAILSPIDPQKDTGESQMSITAVDSMIDLAKKAESESIGTAIIENTVGRMDPVEIAEIYRANQAYHDYAKKLAEQYMFNDGPEKAEQVLEEITKEAPSHDWAIDYHIATEIGLKAERLKEHLSDLAKSVTDRIREEISRGNRNDGRTGEAPYFLLKIPQVIHNYEDNKAKETPGVNPAE